MGDLKEEEIDHTPYISFTPAPGDEFRICPYDKSHRILTTKFASHQLKCRKNYEKMDPKLRKFKIVICPNNPVHHVEEVEYLTFHASNCPDKFIPWEKPDESQNQEPPPVVNTEADASQVTRERGTKKKHWTGSTQGFFRRYAGTSLIANPKFEPPKGKLVVEDWDEECKDRDPSVPSYDPSTKLAKIEENP